MTSERRKPLRQWKWILASSLVLALILVTGCSKTNTESTPTTPATEKPVQETSATPSVSNVEKPTDTASLLQQFQSVIENASNAADILSFIQAHIQDAKQEEADAMLRGLHAFYATDEEAVIDAFYSEQIDKKLAAEEWRYDEEDNADAIRDDQARSFVLNTLTGGYKLGNVGNCYCPIGIDYSVQQSFRPFLSEGMNEYIVLKEQAQDRYAFDGALLITWDELAERALQAEAFLVRYSDYSEQQDIRALYEEYMTSYILGHQARLPYSPMHDPKTYVLLDEVKQSYEQVIAQHPQSATAQIAAEWLELLAASDYKVFAAKNKDGDLEWIPAVQQFEADWTETINKAIDRVI